jgi:hypothetical protein
VTTVVASAFVGAGSVVDAETAGRVLVDAEAAGRVLVDAEVLADAAAGFRAAGRAAGFGAGAGSTEASCGCVSVDDVVDGVSSRADVWRCTSAIVTATRHEAARTTTRPRRVMSGFPVPQRGAEPVSFTGITSSFE